MKRIWMIGIALALLGGCGRDRDKMELAIDGAKGHLVGTRELDVELDWNGAKRLASLSSAHVGERLTITLKNEPVEALTLRAPILDGRIAITLDGDDSVERLKGIAASLR